MTNPPRHIFLSGQKREYFAQPRVLVLLDPGKTGAEGSESTLDVGNVDSVRFWVVNHLHVYVFDVKHEDWHRFRTSYDGCLTEAVNPEGKRRRHLELPARTYQLHFSRTSLKKDQLEGVCDVYKSEVEVKKPTGDVFRPYPLVIPPDCSDDTEYRKFTEVDFLIAEIVKEQLKKAVKVETLDYWESFLFRTSADPKIKKWQTDLQNGIPESAQKVRERLKELRGELFLKVDHENNPAASNPTVTGDPNVRSAESVLLNAYSSDAGVIIPDAPGGESQGKEPGSEDPPADISQVCEVFDLGAKAGARVRTKPLNGCLKKSQLEGLLDDHLPELAKILKKDVKNANRYDVKVVSRLKRGPVKLFETTRDPFSAPDLIKFKLAPFWANDGIEQLELGRLHVGVGFNAAASLADALKNYVYAQQHSVVSKFYDKVVEETKKTRKPEDSGESPTKQKRLHEFALSVKAVHFATESPNFSEQVVPNHVFFQLQSWWQGLTKIQKIELASSVEIDVFGYASASGSGVGTKLGSEERSFDAWLRSERARNTAVALKMVLEQEPKVDRTIKLDDSAAGRPFNRYWNPGKAKAARKYLYISYRDASHGIYPSASLFNKHEKSFSLHCLEQGIEEAAGRSEKSNIQDDRAALIMFKRIVPVGKGRVEWDQKVYGTELVHRFETAAQLIFDSQDSRVPSWTVSLVYACPGTF